MRKWIDLFEGTGDVDYSFTSGEQTTRIAEEEKLKGYNPYKTIPYFDYKEAEKESHFIAYKDDRIVGMAGIQPNPYEEGDLWLKFVSVDANYRNRGIGTFLTQLVIEYAREHDLKLSPSSYTADGEAYIKPIIGY